LLSGKSFTRQKNKAETLLQDFSLFFTLLVAKNASNMSKSTYFTGQQYSDFLPAFCWNPAVFSSNSPAFPAPTIGHTDLSPQLAESRREYKNSDRSLPGKIKIIRLFQRQ